MGVYTMQKVFPFFFGDTPCVAPCVAPCVIGKEK
jgi:hypothetical protein